MIFSDILPAPTLTPPPLYVFDIKEMILGSCYYGSYFKFQYFSVSLQHFFVLSICTCWLTPDATLSTGKNVWTKKLLFIYKKTICFGKVMGSDWWIQICWTIIYFTYFLHISDALSLCHSSCCQLKKRTTPPPPYCVTLTAGYLKNQNRYRYTCRYFSTQE
jgi:hypothetical protein